MEDEERRRIRGLMERWGSGEVNQAVAAVLLTGSIRAEKGDEAAAPTQILCTLLEKHWSKRLN